MEAASEAAAERLVRNILGTVLGLFPLLGETDEPHSLTPSARTLFKSSNEICIVNKRPFPTSQLLSSGDTLWDYRS